MLWFGMLPNRNNAELFACFGLIESHRPLWRKPKYPTCVGSEHRR
mgnify:CR=1 FL=1